jgi:hypothetical protein
MALGFVCRPTVMTLKLEVFKYCLDRSGIVKGHRTYTAEVKIPPPPGKLPKIIYLKTLAQEE